MVELINRKGHTRKKIVIYNKGNLFTFFKFIHMLIYLYLDDKVHVKKEIRNEEL